MPRLFEEICFTKNCLDQMNCLLKYSACIRVAIFSHLRQSNTYANPKTAIACESIKFYIYVSALSNH